jgi:predicted enzyme related to lactoylglutathione lyase
MIYRGRENMTLTQITLAANDVPAMVLFYNEVFGADLRAVAAYGTTLFEGFLAGTPLLLCPNALAGVVAEQNRHQLHFTVTDVEAIMSRTAVSGGAVEENSTEEGGARSIIVRDPDGNTMVVTQQVSELRNDSQHA